MCSHGFHSKRSAAGFLLFLPLPSFLPSFRFSPSFFVLPRLEAASGKGKEERRRERGSGRKRKPEVPRDRNSSAKEGGGRKGTDGEGRKWRQPKGGREDEAAASTSSISLLSLSRRRRGKGGTYLEAKSEIRPLLLRCSRLFSHLFLVKSS